jgi:hypothetical protein
MKTIIGYVCIVKEGMRNNTSANDVSVYLEGKEETEQLIDAM